jgi:hypothetical protein
MSGLLKPQLTQRQIRLLIVQVGQIQQLTQQLIVQQTQPQIQLPIRQLTPPATQIPQQIELTQPIQQQVEAIQQRIQVELIQPLMAPLILILLVVGLKTIAQVEVQIMGEVEEARLL